MFFADLTGKVYDNKAYFNSSYEGIVNLKIVNLNAYYGSHDLRKEWRERVK